jgi:type IV secretion system protein VirB8
MDQISKSVQEYVKSGEYFADAKEWHSFKYLYPLTQRSWLVICAGIILLLFTIIALGFSSLLPIVKKIHYSLYTPDIYNSVAVITNAGQISNNPRASIADVMVRDYITHKEQFDYDRLREQFTYMQNSSTKVMFRKFYKLPRRRDSSGGF